MDRRAVGNGRKPRLDGRLQDLLTYCDDRTKEKNVIRKSPSICTTLARREYWGAVDVLPTKTDQTIEQHYFSLFFLVSEFRGLAMISHVLTYNVLSYEMMHLIRLFD